MQFPPRGYALMMVLILCMLGSILVSALLHQVFVQQKIVNNFTRVIQIKEHPQDATSG